MLYHTTTHQGEASMDNVKMTVAGNTLTITIDLSQDLGPSASGKTRLVASTHGATKVKRADGVEVAISLNAYTK